MATRLRALHSSTALACLLGLGSIFPAGSVLASSEFPSKPLRVIVPFPPGGGSDFVMRALSPQLSEQLGQQVLIDNRPGAQGVIGTQMLARASNDGYTLAVVDAATVIMPILISPAPFDLIKDFSAVALLVENPFLVSVHPSVPVKTMSEFIKLAQAHPGKFNYGSGSANSHIAQAQFFALAKMKLTHVPYRGNGPLIAAALGNEIQINFTGPGSILPQVRSGKLRLLAVTSIKRFREAPDVPTLDEIGYKGTNLRSWLGLLAPAGTPRPVVQKLNATINRILSNGPASQVLLERGYDLNPDSPESFSTFLASEHTRVQKAIKEFGVSAP